MKKELAWCREGGGAGGRLERIFPTTETACVKALRCARAGTCREAKEVPYDWRIKSKEGEQIEMQRLAEGLGSLVKYLGFILRTRRSLHRICF